MTILDDIPQLSDKQQELIKLLSDGKCYSGELIGASLGVSRTTIWKQLQKLSDYGLDINSVKGQGYFLSRPIELLDRDQIYRSISPEVKEFIADIVTPFSVTSTNDYVLNSRSKLKKNTAYVCLAEYQLQGRGRRGRHWVSPLGCNLYLSCLWRFEDGASVLEGLSLAVAVVVAKGLKSLGCHNVSLKWPNDILVDGKKLGGILLEMSGDPSGRCDVVAGIGVNYKMPASQSGIDQSWLSLDDVVPDLSRNEIAIELIEQVVSLFASYSETGFSCYVEEWRSLDAYVGKPVNVISGDLVTSGVALGIADNGALIVDVDGIEKTFYGGELSLRLNSQVKV